MRSSGTMGSGLPSASSEVYPNMRSAAGFHRRTLRSASSCTMPSGEASKSARMALLLSRRASSTRLRAVMSSRMPTPPVTCPLSPRMGAKWARTGVFLLAVTEWYSPS